MLNIAPSDSLVHKSTLISYLTDLLVLYDKACKFFTSNNHINLSNSLNNKVCTALIWWNSNNNNNNNNKNNNINNNNDDNNNNNNNNNNNSNDNNNNKIFDANPNVQASFLKVIFVHEALFLSVTTMLDWNRLQSWVV